MKPGTKVRNRISGVAGTYIRRSIKPNYHGHYVVFVKTTYGEYYAPEHEWKVEEDE